MSSTLFGLLMIPPNTETSPSRNDMGYVNDDFLYRLPLKPNANLN